MKKLWEYEDYVKYLTHRNGLVRRWAFEALEKHFPNRYTDKVSHLIHDENEYLAIAALRYVGENRAFQHGPVILDRFKSATGLIPGHCARALARMGYAPALEVVLEHFESSVNEDQVLGILDYLGHIPGERSRRSLKSAVMEFREEILVDAAAVNLLQHHVPEDLSLIMDKYFEGGNDVGRRSLRYLSGSLGGLDYFKDLSEYRSDTVIENPAGVIHEFLSANSNLQVDEALTESLIQPVKQGRYELFVERILSDSRTIYDTRYPGGIHPAWLSNLFGQDILAIRLFEELSERVSAWKPGRRSEKFTEDTISLILSIYFALKERAAYINALSPEADLSDIILALKNAGGKLPIEIQDKIVRLSPITELKETLTKGLNTWGDIWTVRTMGRIGSKKFASDLLRVLNDSDSMDYIYGDAIEAINALDESADESLLSAIQNKELDEWASFPIIEHLPYAEAYDLALQMWESDNSDAMDSHELFASCLLGIGDSRGISKLQDIYAGENDAGYIGDALECLSEIYRVEIPELSEIVQKRKKALERQKRRQKRLNELAMAHMLNKDQELPEASEGQAPFKRDTPKVGRNEPCPCGSGKKYKKCCLK